MQIILYSTTFAVSPFVTHSPLRSLSVIIKALVEPELNNTNIFRNSNEFYSDG